MQDNSGFHVMVAPLNWGLGHAARCIPVIRYLLLKGYRVLLAGDGDSLMMLRREFPSVAYAELPSYGVKYPEDGRFFKAMIGQLPRFLKAIYDESEETDEIVRKKMITHIISDNRYGCYHDRARKVILTHQLNIQLPAYLSWSSVFLEMAGRSLLNRFDSVWVPDYPNSLLSGELSTLRVMDKHYIGPLSRMKASPKKDSYKYKVLGIVSGPEPQRSIFEQMLTKEFMRLNSCSLLVCGNPGDARDEQVNDNFRKVGFMDSPALQEAIDDAEFIIARSGYSTIMDLSATGKRAILIPTPGQSEQEYLAGKFRNEKIFYSTDQNEFNLLDSLAKAETYSGFSEPKISADFQIHLDRFLSRL